MLMILARPLGAGTPSQRLCRPFRLFFLPHLLGFTPSPALTPGNHRARFSTRVSSKYSSYKRIYPPHYLGSSPKRQIYSRWPFHAEGSPADPAENGPHGPLLTLPVRQFGSLPSVLLARTCLFYSSSLLNNLVLYNISLKSVTIFLRQNLFVPKLHEWRLRFFVQSSSFLHFNHHKV